MRASRVKTVLITAAVIIAIVVAIVFYWTRNQEIHFAENFPDSFEYYVEGYNVHIAKGSREYAVIKAWFAKNTNSWKNDIGDYAPRRLLRSKTITINIFKTAVVVNYTLDGNSWSQVSRTKAEDDLIF